MLVACGILLIVFFGLLLSLLIVSEMHLAARLGFAYVLGLGVLTILMFVALLLGIPLTFVNVFLFVLLLTLFLSFFLRKQVILFLDRLKTTLFLFEFNKINKIEKMLIIAIVFLILYAVVVSLYWPVHAWDALTLYDFRGKILANPESALSYMKGEFNWFYYGYPLLTSLSHTLVYLLGGKNPLFLSALFYIAFAFIFYGTVRCFSSRFISLLVTFLLISNFQVLRHVTLAYSNLPYTVYFSMGTVYLLTWMIKKKRGYFLIGSVLIALSVWTRDAEPFWLANLGVLMVYALFQRNPFPPMIYTVFVFPIRFFWGVYKEKITGHLFETSNQLRNALMILIGNLDYNRMKKIVEYLVEIIFNSWGPVLILFLFLLALDYKNLCKKKNLYLLLFIFLNFICLFLGTYVFSFILSDWEKIPDSVTRISACFYPLLLYFVATSVTIKKFSVGRDKND